MKRTLEVSQNPALGMSQIIDQHDFIIN